MMRTITDYKIAKMSALLLVADLDRALEFYTKILGFDVDFRYEDFYSGIIKDGHSIHLKLAEPPKITKKANDDPDIIFSVDRIKDLYREISGKSVNIVQPLRDMAYGEEFYVADPDGHVIAFLEV